jgi:hypothetical protein
MTYQDPKLPDPGLGRNPPRYPGSDGLGIESILVMAVIVAAIVGIIFFAANDPSSTSASNPPPTTTGQGGTQSIPPATTRQMAPRTAPNPAAPSNPAPNP